MTKDRSRLVVRRRCSKVTRTYAARRRGHRNNGSSVEVPCTRDEGWKREGGLLRTGAEPAGDGKGLGETSGVGQGRST
jgi:hypothetical protein